MVHGTPRAALFARLARIDEIEMRVGLLREHVEGSSDDELVELFDVARNHAALGNADAQASFLAMGWVLFDPVVAARRPRLCEVARAADRHHVADLFAPPGDDPTERGGERRIPDFGRGRPLTLGERKSLARTHDRALIQRVVRDPHPDVIRILLDNPSLTEADVVRVCAARPNDPEVLRTVYLHRRWVVRYRPRNALLRNPDTPVDIALLLAPLLRLQELREAASSAELSAALRLSCKAILDDRASRPPTE